MDDKALTPDLPRFDDLPRLPRLELAQAWDVWGRDDQLGTANFLTPDAVTAACRAVDTGEVVRLDHPLGEPSPPLYGRSPFTHTVFATGRNTWDDKLDGLHPQASTQWDSLRHVRCREFGFWGGETRDPDTHDRLGVDHLARRGIVGRGVLLDLPRALDGTAQGFDPASETSISPEVLAAVADDQGVELRAGDVLCVRFGWSPRRHQESAGGVGGSTFAGLSAGEETARFLWDHRVAAVVADNPAVEVSPGDPAVGSLHRRLIPLLGYVLGELFDLDHLAERCAALRRWDFLFSAAPLYLPGGVGSPGNAMAVL